MARQVKVLLVLFLAAVRADFDALLADDCTEECQVELRQLRGLRTAKEAAFDQQEPADAIPEEDEAKPAAAPESPAAAPVVEAKATCTSLENHGSFSSAKVGIGTPPQYFELVADTGSDNVIVQSCICKEQRFCPQDFGKCFRGTGRSSTFHIDMAQNEEGQEGLKGFVMSFGSGDILVVKSSDKVEVGDANAFMNQSLLLMVKQDLKIRGQFEGILGLGRPHRGEHAAKMVPGFMKLAGIERFSMCFNDEGPGVLGLNEPRSKEALQSVGAVHWGLDFRGITVGQSTEPLNFCQEKKPDMQSACGLIPDSGTTLIMGPKDEIEKLYEGICLAWPRCKEMHQALQNQLTNGRRKSAHRKVVVARMQAMLQAGSADIVHIYHDEVDGPDGDDDFEAAPDYEYDADLGAAPYDGTGPDDVQGPGPSGEYKKEYDDYDDYDDYDSDVAPEYEAEYAPYEEPEEFEAPYDGPGPEYDGPGPEGSFGPGPGPKPDEYSRPGPGPEGEPDYVGPAIEETAGPGPEYEAPDEGPGPSEENEGPGPSYGGDLRVASSGPEEEPGFEGPEAETEPMEPMEPMEPETEGSEEAGASVEIPDAAGVPESSIPVDPEEPTEPSGSQTGLPEEISLASTFVLLMKNCYTWLGNSTDLNTEMPDLNFKVAGTAGGQETLKLDANSYTFLTTVPIIHKEVEYFLGYLPVEVVTVRNEQVCLPAFSSMNYTTQKNGPVWIMGTPLFYSYKVQYDREPEPPTMSFGKGCGTCHEGTEGPPSERSAQLLQKKEQKARGIHRLRKLTTPPVAKKIDPTMPL